MLGECLPEADEEREGLLARTIRDRIGYAPTPNSVRTAQGARARRAAFRCLRQTAHAVHPVDDRELPFGDIGRYGRMPEEIWRPHMNAGDRRQAHALYGPTAPPLVRPFDSCRGYTRRRRLSKWLHAPRSTYI